MPGCEGAKLRTTLQWAPAARGAAQLVVWAKSPVRVVESAKAMAPVFAMVTVWVSVETPVTTTGLANETTTGETLREGLTEVPLTPGWGRVSPVRRALRPASRARVMASEEVDLSAW